MDTPYLLPRGTAHWLDAVGLETRWRIMQRNEPVDASGHLIGECLDADVDFGRVPSGNILVNGAQARVQVDGEVHRITQSLT